MKIAPKYWPYNAGEIVRDINGKIGEIVEVCHAASVMLRDIDGKYSLRSQEAMYGMTENEVLEWKLTRSEATLEQEEN